MASAPEPTSAAPAPSGDASPQPPFRQGAHKSCDACKARKVKCPNVDYPAPCGNCVRRKETCLFGKKRVPRRNVTKHLRYTRSYNAAADIPSPVEEALRYVDEPNPTPQAGKLSSTPPAAHLSPGAIVPAAPSAIPTLYIDHLLSQALPACQDGSSAKAGEMPPVGKAISIFGGSYSLTYFSESRLRSLSTRLRNHKVDELVCRINSQVRKRLLRPAGAPGSSLDTAADGSSKPIEPIAIDPEFSSACIGSYFERSHALLPFLDRASFEARVKDHLSPVGEKTSTNSGQKKAWSALYHSVLAIGCAYNTPTGKTNGFEPGTSTAWRLFARGALTHLADLLVLPEDSLLALQALTAMCVYGLGVACLSIERVLLAEAVRRAQALAQTGATSSLTFQRTFWVVYAVEKVTSFHFGRSSTFMDSDIACPLPPPVENTAPLSSTWMILSIRHARLLSRTYVSLFSVGSSCNTTTNSLANIDQLHNEVEAWRLSIPVERGLRPEKEESFISQSSSSQALRSSDPNERLVTLALRYMYHSLILVLSRAKLHHLSQLPATDRTEQTSAARASAQNALVVAARAILALTPAVDVEPHTPLWVLAVVPLMALLVLFDVVVHVPADKENSETTGLNLVLLDMGAGYFSRIEYASGGSLPGSLLSEFAHIARDYINHSQRRAAKTNNQNQPAAKSQQLLSTPLAQNTSQPLIAPQTVPSQVLDVVDNMSTSLRWPITNDEPVAGITGAGLPPNSMNFLATPTDTAFANNNLALNEEGTTSSVNSDGYGFTTGYWNGAGNGDLSGTDIMGLFTNNYYFLPEMDGILFNGYGEL